jgi:flagellar FliL protein
MTTKEPKKSEPTDGKKPEGSKDKKGEPQAEAKPPLKGKRLAMLIAIVVGVAAAGAGATWMLMSPSHKQSNGAKKEAAAEESEDAAPGKAGAAKAPDRPRPDKSAPPLFLALETFTVNLQTENGDHMLQTNLSLKITDAAVEAALKLHMPEIRSRLLLLLSSKKPSELSTVEGKQVLATQIGEDVNAVLDAAGIGPAGGEGPVLSVFFTAFIVQ